MANTTIKHLEDGIEINNLKVNGSTEGISYNDLEDKPSIPSAINLENGIIGRGSIQQIQAEQKKHKELELFVI